MYSKFVTINIQKMTVIQNKCFFKVA